MLTEAMIRRLAPRARDDYAAALVDGGPVFAQWEINTPNRLAAFLATCLAETGGLTIVQENTTYTTAQRIAKVWPSRFSVSSAARYVRQPEALAEVVYGGRMGNQRNGVGDGDGYRYRGRGFVQTTGRDGYERMGRLVGLPLGEKPELLDDPVNSLKAACAECAKFNTYADRGEKGFFAYSNGINRGNPQSSQPPIGWEDRIAWYRRVVKELAVPYEMDDDTSELGDRGALIEGYQKRLAELGYPIGTIDGVFGSRTRAAVLAFQAENGIATDGQIGPVTRAALNRPDAKPLPSGDRAKATEDDLAKSGSGTISDARAIDVIAKGVVATGAVAEVQKNTDALGQVQTWVSDMTAIRAVVDPAIVIVKWSLSFWWLFAIVAGLYIIQKTSAIRKARLLAHRLGQHLGR
jgi:putative chitinase